MSNQELVHEIDSEKDSDIQILKSKLNNLRAHAGSPVMIASDSQDTNHASVVSDEVLVRTNTVPYIYANESTPNNFGDAFVESAIGHERKAPAHKDTEYTP